MKYFYFFLIFREFSKKTVKVTRETQSIKKFPKNIPLKIFREERKITSIVNEYSNDVDLKQSISKFTTQKRKILD